MSILDASPITENPTWETPIRQFFNVVDVAHMLRYGMDLASYNSVTSERWREKIWESISDRRMPVAPSTAWTDEMIVTYRKWLDNSFPRS